MTHLIFVPEDLIAKLPAKFPLRVEGIINGVAFALAIQTIKGHGKYFSISAEFRKKAKLEEGVEVQIQFNIVDPDKLDIPEELEAVMAQDEEGAKMFEALTTGYKRSLLHYITSAKSVDTRIKRSLELIHKIKTRQFVN